MDKQQIDWDEALKVFWERFAQQAPRTFDLQASIGQNFQTLWNQVNPAVGLEGSINIFFLKDGTLLPSMAGWVLLGIIARVAGSDAVNTFQKNLEERLNQLDTKWTDKLQKIEERLKPVEEYCGIIRPKGL